VLTAPVVQPGRTSDDPPDEQAHPALPTVPEPLPDGGADRLVVVTRAPVADRPSATLLAAQQLSDEADLHPHRSRGPGTPAADRRRRRQRALVAQRRVDRAGLLAGEPSAG
jgi:hypothetical protein